MFKRVHNKVWVFDAEWIPDTTTGRTLYNLSESLGDREVMEEMWIHNGASEENPMPYLKTAICRLVSVSAVTRTEVNGEVKLHLSSLPHDAKDPEQILEKNVISSFLNAIGAHKPQLVGYNSYSSDLKILIQRGLAQKVQAKSFCSRPDKPWEGVDYFTKGNDWHIDLKDILGGWGAATPSLNELAVASKIPGKIVGDGQSVAPLWLEGALDKIVAYNEFDALTTYLVWLRTAFFAGFFTIEELEKEENLLKELLIRESSKPERFHLEMYLTEWEKLK